MREELFDEVKALDEELQKLPKLPREHYMLNYTPGVIVIESEYVPIESIIGTGKAKLVDGYPFEILSPSNELSTLMWNISWPEYHLMNAKQWLKKVFHA